MPWSTPHGHKFTSAAILTNVPKQPGVYGLYGGEGWVFIGKSDNLQQTLFQCLDKRRQYFWPNEPDAFTFELCSVEESHQRQGDLILEFYPLRNHLPEAGPARMEKAG